MRDLAGIRGVGLPVWCNGIAAPPSVAGLTFVGWQEPIGCGGVAVFPDDVIVADEDGAVVIPAALLDEVLAAGPEQERYEAWVVAEVERGVPLPGLYPPNAETKARYEADAIPADEPDRSTRRTGAPSARSATRRSTTWSTGGSRSESGRSGGRCPTRSRRH